MKLLTYLLTELSPSWEAANCAATQELPSILYNPEVHYRVHKRPPPIPILSQIDPVHTTSSHYSKMHFNVVHPPTSWSSKWCFSLWLSDQYPTYKYIPLLTIRAKYPAHIILLLCYHAVLLFISFNPKSYTLDDVQLGRNLTCCILRREDEVEVWILIYRRWWSGNTMLEYIWQNSAAV
jgi:hypothetical protein